MAVFTFTITDPLGVDLSLFFPGLSPQDIKALSASPTTGYMRYRLAPNGIQDTSKAYEITAQGKDFQVLSGTTSFDVFGFVKSAVLTIIEGSAGPRQLATLDVTLGVLSSENGGSPAVLGNMTPDYLMVHEPSFFNVNGGNGNDQIIGTGWGDELDGGGGRDRMAGRVGNDTYYADNAGDVVVEAEGEGFDTVVASVSYTLASGLSVESLTGIGDNVPMTLTGNSYGQTIEGNDSANTLNGMAGDDSLFGYLGNDILIGGLGRDSMRGHGGADRFDFNSVKESVVGAKRDVVNDFQKKIDKIDLSTVDADTDGTAGNQAFKWIGSKAFSGVDGQLRFANGILRGDTNGDRKADFEIQIKGALAAADIIL